MRRGEIWWANLSPPANNRPVLLLTRNEAYGRRTHITVCPFTKRKRGLATEVPFTRSEGMPVDSVANLDNIITIPVDHLERQIAHASDEKMLAVRDAIFFALDL